MFLLKKLIFIFLVLFSFILQAEGLNSTTMKVISIESQNNASHDIYFSDTVPTQGCSIEDRAAVNGTTDGDKFMASVLLSAFISGKEVVIRVDNCLADRPKITKIRIVN